MRFGNRVIKTMYDGFSAIPGFWEIDAWTCRATASSPYRRKAIELLRLGPDSSVLDVACGTGLNFPELQRHLKGRGRLVSVDLSPKTLKLARRQVRRKGWTNVELVESSSSEYEPTQAFDACLCTFAIDIIPPYLETLEMMLAAIRPSGRIALIGFRRSDSRIAARFDPALRAMAFAFGGVDLDRNVPAVVRERCREVHFETCFGGFYYIQVAEKEPDRGRS